MVLRPEATPEAVMPASLPASLDPKLDESTGLPLIVLERTVTGDSELPTLDAAVLS